MVLLLAFVLDAKWELSARVIHVRGPWQVNDDAFAAFHQAIFESDFGVQDFGVFDHNP